MDLTSPKVIKDIAARFDFSFSKGLGQNFLKDGNVLKTIAASAGSSDGALEIGPGFGVLTRELAKRFPKVVSIELDKRLLPVLDYTLAGFDNVKIISADVLKLDLEKLIDEEFGEGKISIAANLPYYITTPVIVKLLESRLPLQNIVVMVQKEVAERICAAPGGKEYGAISVLCGYYSEPEIEAVVPAGSFVPAPKVDSAVLKMKILDKPAVGVLDERLFFKVVRAAFAQRRKTLLNCLANGFCADKNLIAAVLENCGIPANIRGEKLSVPEFAKIADEMSENGF